MFSSPWDLVRPRCWYPMSSVEQSMMDLELMRNRMLRARFPFHDELLSAPSAVDDDDFFRDLPVAARAHRPAARQQEQQQPAATADSDAEADAEADAASHGRAFSSYSFSSSSVVDDKGQRVSSTRRRYEDSTGRLKAVHERQIEDKQLRAVWSRQSADDAGVHESTCSSGSAEEFERLWQATPFGEAQKKTITHGQQREDDSDAAAEQQQQQQQEEEGEARGAIDTSAMEFVDVPAVADKKSEQVAAREEQAPAP